MVVGDKRFVSCNYDSATGPANNNCQINAAASVSGLIYYLATRDTNIVVLNGDTDVRNVINKSKPMTITSYATGNGTIRNVTYIRTNANSDLNFENLKINETSNINANGMNFKIGRNVTSSTVGQFNAGTNNTGNRFTVIVESGIYSNFYGVGSGTSNARLILGSDYDRVNKRGNIDLDAVAGGDNSRLRIGNRFFPSNSGNTESHDIMIPFVYTIVKSGSIGCSGENTYNRGDGNGIYLQPYSSNGYSKATSRTYVYGGYINTVYGGSGHGDDYTTVNATDFHLLGGTVGTYIGGSTSNPTYRNRIATFSGGNVLFNVIGGSNAHSTTNNTSGIIYGDTLIYIGGTAVIGADVNKTDYTSNLAGYAIIDTRGNVFGAGLGNLGYPAGSVDNSNIIINGGTIKGNVYGGGNNGVTGQQSSGDSSANIKLLGGNIEGSVFGAGNNSGGGKENTSGGSSIVNGNYYRLHTVSTNIGTKRTQQQRCQTNGGCRENGTWTNRGNATTANVNETGVIPAGSYLFDGTYISTNTTCSASNGTNSSTVSYNTYENYSNSSNNGIYAYYTTRNLVTYNYTSNIECNYFMYENTDGQQQSGNYYELIDGSFVQVVPASSTSNNYKHTINITLDGATVNGSIYGGSNSDGDVYGNVNINLISGKVNNGNNGVYGGGKGQPTVVYGNININSLNTDNSKLTINNVYGGSALGSVNEYGKCEIIIDGGTFTNVYGGSEGNNTTTPNSRGDINVKVKSGAITTLFGGNNLKGTPEKFVHVIIEGGTVTDVYGGGNATAINSTTVDLNGGTITGNVYGGSNSGDASLPIVNLKGSTVNNIFGGCNTTGNVVNTQVNLLSGTINGAVYGGNNAGGTATNTYVYATNTSENFGGDVYGCGYGAGTSCVKTNVYIGSSTKTPTFDNVFGGGKATNVTGNTSGQYSTNILIENGTITGKVFGGSDSDGTVNSTMVNIKGGTINAAYGGNNAGGVTTTSNITLDGGTISTNLFGGGDQTRTGTSNVIINSGTVTSNVFGGGNAADVTNVANVTLNGGTVDKVFGGSNSSGNVATSHVLINNNVTSVYGGNNAGGKTNNANVQINSGNITNVFGGGNQAATGYTNLVVGLSIDDSSYSVASSPHITNVYGGGNENIVENNTNLVIKSGVFAGSVFGGGNQGNVNGNTVVTVYDASIAENLFAGGNSGNTGGALNPDDTLPAGATLDHYSVLNLLGGTIGRNVYGGANSARVLGKACVRVGMDSVTNSNCAGYEAAYPGLTYNDAQHSDSIIINGTIFGGSELNAGGSDDYDFDSISVYNGIYLDINGHGYTASNGKPTLDIKGSIYGSGNASSAQGDSIVRIKELGNANGHVNIGCISRADKAYIFDSYIRMFGENDNTSIFGKAIKFSLNRLNNLFLIGHTELYMEYNANVLKNYNSCSSYTDVGGCVLETLSIDDNGALTYPSGITDGNKLYIAKNKNINVLKVEDVLLDSTGDVNGMSFMGMFIYQNDANQNEIFKGLYDTSYRTGDTPTSDADIENFAGYSTYVLGTHLDDSKVLDTYYGFYSNYYDEETGLITVDNVLVDPPNASYYYWRIGEASNIYSVNLEVSKFTTEGTNILYLSDTTDINPGTKFTLKAFNPMSLEGVSLVSPSSVPKAAATTELANSVFSLQMENTGGKWSSGELVTFYSADYGGTSHKYYPSEAEYISDSSSGAGALAFSLIHSMNVELPEDCEDESMSLGYAEVRFEAQVPDPEDPTITSFHDVIIVVNIALTNYDEDGYSSAIAPGKKYGVFKSVETKINDGGSFSIYESMYLDLNKLDKEDNPWGVDENNDGIYTDRIYRTGAYRALRTDYSLPAGTFITMLDLITNEYYYYEVTPAIEAAKNAELAGCVGNNCKVAYNLSDFIAMASTTPTNKYNELQHMSVYNETTNPSGYYHQGTGDDKGFVMEEFIFTFDFDGVVIPDIVNSYMYMDLRCNIDGVDTVIVQTMDDYNTKLAYSVIPDSDAQINTVGDFEKDSIYLGDRVKLELTTTFNQGSYTTVEDGITKTTTVYDTTFDDYKLGVKISVYDKNGNKLDSTSLLGVSFTLDGKTYYPETDGTTRISLGNKVSNVISNVYLNTANSNISTDEYKFVIESFGSYDGFYYGEGNVSVTELNLDIKNNSYGIDYNMDDKYVIHNYLDGSNIDGENEVILSNINVSSGFNKPKLVLYLEKRNYQEGAYTDSVLYDNTYNKVNISNIFDMSTTSFIPYDSGKYVLYDSNSFACGVSGSVGCTLSIPNVTLKVKDDAELERGTYRLHLAVYDEDSYIGSVYKYIIIMKM